jgi:hypothetical protein
MNGHDSISLHGSPNWIGAAALRLIKLHGSIGTEAVSAALVCRRPGEEILVNFGWIHYLSDRRKLGLLIAGATILRLALALTGLGADESYTVATSRAFHLSVYDHPPMAWWLAWLAQTLFHSSAPVAVRLPFIILSAIATWQIAKLTQILFGARAGLFATLAFVCAPALGLTDGTWVLPDGPLIVGLLAGAICLAHLFFERPESGWLWLAAGFWGGIALLSKYHGVFLFAGAGLFILMVKEERRWLLSIWPYLGLLTGLAVFSPVLVWNYEHDWISLAFQSDRVGIPQFHPFRPVETLLAHALFLTPWLWAGLAAAGLKAARIGTKDRKQWFLICLAAPQIALFTLASTGTAGWTVYHWAMPGYLFLFPLLGDWLARQSSGDRLWPRRAAVASGSAAVALVLAAVLFWYVPVNPDALREMRSFGDIETYVGMSGYKKRDRLVVAPASWYFAGKLDYALKGRVTVTCLCNDAREYGVLAPLKIIDGEDFIVPVPLKDAEGAAKKLPALFQKTERLNNLVIRQGSIMITEFAVFYGQRLTKPSQTPQPMRMAAPARQH